MSGRCFVSVGTNGCVAALCRLVIGTNVTPPIRSVP